MRPAHFNPGNVLMANNTAAAGGGLLMTSPSSALGAIPKKMAPSPAAQVSLFENIPITDFFRYYLKIENL
jgi:hypothetical protein